MIPLNRTCKEVAAILIAREDRDMPMSERLALRLHMSICDTCPIFARQVLTMRNAFRQWRGYEEHDEGN